MKVTEVTYERLSKQRVAQYENERSCITISLDEDDSPEAATRWAKRLVDEALGLAEGSLIESRVPDVQR